MIKIQNIYYMLAYAFQVLNEDSYNKVALEDFEYAEDLLAAILAKGIANQIKRGLGREYVMHTEAPGSPRGKIKISVSLKEKTLLQKRLVCEYDEFSENAYINQIIKTTALMLLRSEEVRADRKRSLKKVLRYFSAVDAINPRSIRWASIKYHSNNATYKMLINICYLVIEALLPTTQTGSKKVSQFKDEHLHRLYERFVLAYYRKHYENRGIIVSSSHIGWNTDDGMTDLLPTMKSDIVLEHNEKTLIIDTKYYSRTMQTNRLYNSRTLHSGNLYQIYAYVKNKDIRQTGNVSGLLLYAKTDEKITPDNSYIISGNRIGVKTLDLDKNFDGIQAQLDRVVEEWLQ